MCDDENSLNFQQFLREKQFISPSKNKTVIDVWEGMRIRELGEAMGRDSSKSLKDKVVLLGDIHCLTKKLYDPF